MRLSSRKRGGKRAAHIDHILPDTQPRIATYRIGNATSDTFGIEMRGSARVYLFEMTREECEATVSELTMHLARAKMEVRS